MVQFSETPRGTIVGRVDGRIFAVAFKRDGKYTIHQPGGRPKFTVEGALDVESSMRFLANNPSLSPVTVAQHFEVK